MPRKGWLYNLRRLLAKKLDPVSQLMVQQITVDLEGGLTTPAQYDIYSKAYMQSTWVHICVSFIAESCASIPADVYEQKEENKLERIPDHPLDLLLEKPHPKISRSELWIHTFSSLELNGQAFWYLVKNPLGQPIQIIPLYSHRVKIIPSKSDLIGGYLYTIEGQSISLEADEVIQFKRWHPLNDFYGFSAIEAASQAIATDIYAQTYNQNFFKSDATPAGILKTEQKLNSDEVKELQKRWEEGFKGVKKAHKIAILGQGLEFKNIAIAPKDAEFLAQREFSRDEILSIFRVPPSLLGIYNRYRATNEGEEQNFNQHTIAPKLVAIGEKITAELLPMFGETSQRLLYKFDTLLAREPEEERNRDEIDAKYGILTPDEIRARRYGLPPLPDDMGSLPYTYINIKASPFAELEPPKEKIIKAIHFNREGWERKLKKFWEEIFIKQKWSVLESIKKNSQKGLDDWDQDWDRWLPIIFPAMIKDISDLFQEGINATREYGFAPSFNASHERAQAWIKEHVLEKMVYQIQNTTREQIVNLIIKGIEESQSITQISERIDELFISKIAYHSELIARTEVASAYNWGSYLTYQEFGIAKKKWLTARDERVCQIHCKPNEQVGAIDMKALFPSGHECPPAHPRCRCTILPIIE